MRSVAPDSHNEEGGAGGSREHEYVAFEETRLCLCRTVPTIAIATQLDAPDSSVDAF